MSDPHSAGAPTAEPSQRRPARLELLRRLAVATVLVLLTFELIVRNYQFAPTVPDPVLGSVQQSGVNLWGSEGRARSTFQGGGLRRQSAWSAAAPRVLVLGDSFTEALMIEDGATFPEIAERELGRRGVRVQLLNHGHSSWSVADYVFYAPHFRRVYTPSWTVVQLGETDVRADAFSSELGKAAFSDRNGELELIAPLRSPTTATRRAFTALRQRSALVSLAHNQLMAWMRASRAEPPLFFAGRRTSATTAERDYPIESEIELLARSYDRRVTVAYVAKFDPRRETDEPAIERRMREACARSGIGFVTLRSEFHAFLRTPYAPFGFGNSGFNTGHLNERGHAALARALIPELERVLRGIL